MTGRLQKAFFACLMLLMIFSGAAQAQNSVWLSLSSYSHLRPGQLSGNDLGPLVWSRTGVDQPQGYVVRREAIAAQPVSMRVVFELPDRLANYKQIYIAGFVSEPELSRAAQPILALRWVKTSGEGRDRWQLELVAERGLIADYLSDETDGCSHIVRLSLPLGYPRRGDKYTAMLSFDPQNGQLHLALEDDPAGVFPLAFSANLDTNTYQQGLYPISGWEGDNVQGLAAAEAYLIHELQVTEEFTGEGLPLEIGEELEFFLVGEGGERSYVSSYYNDEKLFAALKWPENPLPGEIRLTFVRGEEQQRIFETKWAEERQIFPFPALDTLPFGRSLLLLEYCRDGRVSTISKQEVNIVGNRAEARFELYGRNYQRSRERAHLPIFEDPGIYGNVIISNERPLQDVPLQVQAVYTGADQQVEEITVLKTTLTSSEANGQLIIPIEFMIPPNGGQVVVSAELLADDIEFAAVKESTPVWPAPMVPAFPGAEGFGAFNPGGRGGQLIRVTNLDDGGPGSLRAAVEAEGPRTVIFDVSGIIELQSRLVIANPYITIAGQSAPGGGITIANYPTQITADAVILRHLRFRLGDLTRQSEDSLEIKGNNVIADHVSATWGIDETLSVTDAHNVTVQWSLIAQSLNRSVHEKGAHGYGSLIRGERGACYSFHHNLWAHHRSRMPRPGNYLNYKLDPVGLLADFRNNVIYNWEGSYPGANYDTDSVSRYNFINNYYLPGSNSGDTWAFRDEDPYAQAYFAGNCMDGKLPEDPWSLVRGVGPATEGYRLENELLVAAVATQAAVWAFESVLDQVGAFPRDQVDRAIVSSVIEGTGKIIDSQAEVGGWPPVETGEVQKDADQDGIPDWWEEKYGLDPHDPTDANQISESGYSYLELYLNSLCE